MLIIFSLIRNWIPWINESSSIEPSAHHPALFLIQLGMADAVITVFDMSDFTISNSNFLKIGRSKSVCPIPNSTICIEYLPSREASSILVSMPFGKVIPKWFGFPPVFTISFPDGSFRPYPYRISVARFPFESKNTIEKRKSLLLEYLES